MTAQGDEAFRPPGRGIPAPARSSARSKLRLEVMKYFLPALITGIATIAVGWIKSQADLEKSKLGITGLAENYNTLVDQAKSDHDELNRLRGTVDLLSSAVLKHQDPVVASAGAGTGVGAGAGAPDRPARPAQGRPAPPRPAAGPPAHPVAETPATAAERAPEAEALKKLRDDVRLKPAGVDPRRFDFKVRRAPTNFDQLMKAAPAH